MAEPRVFLKENRGRIEENYLEQAKNLPRVFAPVDEKLQKCTEEVASGIFSASPQPDHQP